MSDFGTEIKASPSLKMLMATGGRKVRQIVTQALLKAAHIVKRRALKLVYAGHPEHLEGGEGHLWKSIAAQAPILDYPQVYVGSDIIYSRVHECGATIANGFGRGIHIKIPPRPFFGPALEDTKDEVEQVFENTLHRRLTGR